MNYIIGIGLLGLGIYSLIRLFKGKAKPSDRPLFKHQTFIFELMLGKKDYYKGIVIFTSTIEILFGLAFIFDLIN